MRQVALGLLKVLRHCDRPGGVEVSRHVFPVSTREIAKGQHHSGHEYRRGLLGRADLSDGELENARLLLPYGERPTRRLPMSKYTQWSHVLTVEDDSSTTPWSSSTSSPRTSTASSQTSANAPSRFLSGRELERGAQAIGDCRGAAQSSDHQLGAGQSRYMRVTILALRLSGLHL
jgi:hypothetical protein